MIVGAASPPTYATPRPAADAELLEAERREELAEELGRLGERAHVEDLAADVRVEPDEREAVGAGEPVEQPSRASPGGDRRAELRVLLAGADELVGVGLDARRHPQQRRLGHRAPRGEARQSLEVVGAVDDDAADPGGRAPSRARRRTCCSRAARAGRPAPRR